MAVSTRLTSSPFHAGRLTGLKSYRQTAIAAIPRTGLPPPMRSDAEYTRVVETYRGIGAIEDGSELRWDIRPSAAYPTIELRICDICPRSEDAVAIAALYACLIRWLAEELEQGKRPPQLRREIIEESDGSRVKRLNGHLLSFSRNEGPSALGHRRTDASSFEA